MSKTELTDRGVIQINNTGTFCLSVCLSVKAYLTKHGLNLMERASPPRSPIPTLSSPPTTVADDVIAMQQAYAVSPAQEAEVVDLSINSPSHQHYRPATDNQQNLRSVREASTGSVLGGSISEHSDPVGIFSGTAVNEPTRTQEGSATQVTASASQPIPVASSSTEPTASSSTEQLVPHPSQGVAVAETSGLQSSTQSMDSTSSQPDVVAGPSTQEQSVFSIPVKGGFKCSACDYARKHNSLIEKHLRVHTGEKPFKCPKCDHSSAQMASLNKHIQRKHRDKQFECTLCQTKFGAKQELQNHIRAIHTKEQKFKCHFCDEMLPTSPHQVSHMKSKHKEEYAAYQAAKKSKTD